MSIDKANNRPDLLPGHTVAMPGFGQAADKVARGIVCNPIYAGIPPYEKLISDAVWIKSAMEMLEKEGPEQFLANLLYLLRKSYGRLFRGHRRQGAADPGSSSAHDASLIPVEGGLFCSHDGLPMIVIDNDFVCTGGFLYEHLADSCVTDLIVEPVLALVFQNGHTLPLICPTCGHSLHIDDLDIFLDEVNGLSLIGVKWNPLAEPHTLIIELGLFEDETKDEWTVMGQLALDIASVRGLTCPTGGEMQSG